MSGMFSKESAAFGLVPGGFYNSYKKSKEKRKEQEKADKQKKKAIDPSSIIPPEHLEKIAARKKRAKTSMFQANETTTEEKFGA